MSQFLTPLRVELLEDAVNEYRGQWRLTAPLVYQSDAAGRTITVPDGFVTDFESCPRVPGLFLAFGELAHAAAVVHDFLYTAPATVSRAVADAVLREACILSGVPAWRAWGVWIGVRVGGAGRYDQA